MVLGPTQGGVAILLNDNFEHEVVHCNIDKYGNYIQMLIVCSSIKINLINVYAPNQDDPNFFQTLRGLVDNAEFDYVMICGDFNLVLDPVLDSYNYNNINNPKARLKLLPL